MLPGITRGFTFGKIGTRVFLYRDNRGNMVKSVKDIKVSDNVNIYVKDGCFTATIYKITENGGNGG